MYISKYKYVYKVLKRSLYLCVLNNSPVVCAVKIFKNINCTDFALVTWFRIASFVVELILYTFGMGGVSGFFFAD